MTYDEKRVFSEAEKIIADMKRQLEVLKEETVGWTCIDYKHGYKSRYHSIDIELWVAENCGDYKKFGTTFYFKEEKDASMFVMKWL